MHFMKQMIMIASLALAANVFAQNAGEGPYQPTWESLSTHKMPAWYEDAKIGLSMHWGVYAVPGWAPREGSISNCRRPELTATAAGRSPKLDPFPNRSAAASLGRNGNCIAARSSRGSGMSSR